MSLDPRPPGLSAPAGRVGSLRSTPALAVGLVLVLLRGAAAVRAQAPGDGASVESATEAPSGAPPGTDAVATPEPRAEEEEQEDFGAPFEGPGWLDRILGLGDRSIHAYGWVQNSFSFNTNGTPPSGDNFDLFPNHLANQWMGNQYYLVLERTLRPDRLDIGFRVDSLFGNDWQTTKQLGFLDNAFPPNTFRGFDLPQAYGEVHLPVFTEGGLDVRFGRWYSIAGYESVMAVKRPLLSWPYVFTYFPFTMSGLLTTFHASDRLRIYNGATTGVDRWFNAHYRWTYVGGVGWTSEDGRTSATLVVMTGPNQFPRFLPRGFDIVPVGFPGPPFRAGLPNPGYAGNNRMYTQNVVTHRWTDRLTQAVEFSAAFDQDTPGAGPAGGARDTRWYGVANWFLYEFTPSLTGTWRTEVFHDGSPFVTGVSDTYYDVTLGALSKPRDWLWLRSEARYDWAQFHEPFSDGTRGSRFTIGFDVIVLF